MPWPVNARRDVREWSHVFCLFGIFSPLLLLLLSLTLFFLACSWPTTIGLNWRVSVLEITSFARLGRALVFCFLSTICPLYRWALRIKVNSRLSSPASYLPSPPPLQFTPCLSRGLLDADACAPFQSIRLGSALVVVVVVVDICLAFVVVMHAICMRCWPGQK